MTSPQLLRVRSSTLCGLGLCALPLLLAFGCSTTRFSTEPGAPTLVMPAHFAEGGGQAGSASAPPSASVSPSASASAVPAASSSAAAVAPALTPSSAPDPTPLRMAQQVEYELELNEGKLRVVSVKAVTLPAPVVTPRRLGRYAIELSIGQELLERVRFDFPGTAADEPQTDGKQRLFAPLTLAERAIARVKIQVPQSPRVRRALLVDRALNTATELEWPLPAVPKAAPSAAATAPSAAATAPSAAATAPSAAATAPSAAATAPAASVAPAGSATPPAKP